MAAIDPVRVAADARGEPVRAAADERAGTVAHDGQTRGVLVIACGALAREIAALRRANGWDRLDVRCLPVELHNRPRAIPDAVRDAIHAHRDRYASIFVAYGDCGTGGELDAVLAAEGVERIPGAHCYEFFAGADAFAALADAEPGTFYVTDFLARHFERLVIRGLGLDRHPELAAQYFGHYRRLVYLAQSPSPASLAAARAAAQRLGLTFEFRPTGYGGLERSLRAAFSRIPAHERSSASTASAPPADAAACPA